MEGEIDKLKQMQVDLEQQIKVAIANRPEGDERAALQTRLADLESRNSAYNAELEQFKEMDPKLFAAKKKATEEAKNGVNRWTDNLFTIQSYCSNNFNISRTDFSNQFGIPEELDYVS